MAAEILNFPARKADHRTEVQNLELELLVRGQEAKRFAVAVENGARRITRLLEADLPVEAHQLASRLHNEAGRFGRRFDPDGGSDVA
jgi:hypothetical protein